MPPEVIHEEVIHTIDVPKPPPIYRYHRVEVPAKTFVDEMGNVRPLTPVQVRPDGPVIGTAERLIQPMSLKYIDGPPAAVPEVPRGTVTSVLSTKEKEKMVPSPQPKTELA